MALANDPSRLNQRVTFGVTQSVENDNGIAEDQFVPSFTVWCGIYNRTLAEKFQVIGTEHSDDTQLIIRHNKDVDDQMFAQLNGDKSVTYQVIDVQPDESPNPVTFDLVTLKKVKV
ncbi:phage head closure protein [Sporolactobacillus sp. CQH2019]|uniref:phage head closure protein n=1 Tax=Sporolactobacillus sp. CQH2019 TaxID=3023512 RepID=UPI00236777DE|nr:phage head closure protein [Sporolactobacillus sp. CQH2019]MDD9147350.1 phage head closure protein [Sporolactobacillus sp. CQH2019]